ncbi:PhzF family phenazine biosynthesis protein [Rathayibacter soli]|uniref:PhzF family phenazine biosynthesis protein n=1 Tax=Rathayibacter soli TaxID=3144168 RepID=UPI0027E49729|nr:PhzF family phenazine biosynthesis protein [Glaciibacter superstes]
MKDDVQVEVVRVFTTAEGQLGNELGIVSASEQTEGREQSVAAALGFSETVFIDDVERGVARIRIFTPATELPFAGHPSVGTAWWLREQGTPVNVLAEAAGEVAVQYDGDLTWISGRASWAPEFEWIECATVDEVNALDPARYVQGHHYAYAWVNEDAGHLRSRMFAPGMGIVEDEATGAAAVRITERLGRNLEITQGRGSRISTRLGPDGIVQVGGRTVFDRTVFSRTE